MDDESGILFSKSIEDLLQNKAGYNDRAGTPRVALYSQDTLGYGHWRRNMLLAGALRECISAPSVLMIAGMHEAGAFELPDGVDSLTLPAYSKDSAGKYCARSLGLDLCELSDLRSKTIKAALTSFDPDLLIVDNTPRGAQFELDRTLKALKKRGRAKIVLGLRDIIDAPAKARRQWEKQGNSKTFRKYYDHAWVYGDPNFFDTITEYGLEKDFAGKASFTGYLSRETSLESAASSRSFKNVIGNDPRPYVFCAVGGGRDGGKLADAFARASFPGGQRGILVCGTQMPLAKRIFLRETAAARDDLVVFDLIPEPIELMQKASRLITMGGYNTVCEILSLGQKALVVPRIQPRTEQWIRATRLAEKGLIDFISPDEVSPKALNEWMSSQQKSLPSVSSVLNLDGLRTFRRLADEVLGKNDSRTMQFAQKLKTKHPGQ